MVPWSVLFPCFSLTALLKEQCPFLFVWVIKSKCWDACGLQRVSADWRCWRLRSYLVARHQMPCQLWAWILIIADSLSRSERCLYYYDKFLLMSCWKACWSSTWEKSQSWSVSGCAAWKCIVVVVDCHSLQSQNMYWCPREDYLLIKRL